MRVLAIDYDAMTYAPLAIRQRALRFAIMIALYIAVTLLIPRPDGIAPGGWRLTGLFVATVAGLMLQPLPGGAIVLIAVTLAPLLTDLKLSEALGGYADPTVWLVLAAFIIARALLNTGLARRIALFFVRWFGSTSIGIAYSMGISDAVLASIIPSNGARSGGVTLPILRSIAELYDSHPGATAGRLGEYLMLAVSQSICVSAAMFFTGQASNPLAAQMATAAGYPVTWGSWFIAALVPGLLSLAAAPWVAMKLYPPEIRRTPRASEFARSELAAMGPMRREEWILAAVFVSVCGMWITSPLHKLDIAIPALCGSVSLLIFGVVTWDDVIGERLGWDIFLWYGGLLRLGKALNDAHVTSTFAASIGGVFHGLSWPWLLVVAVLIYFYAHYAYASITAHILSMFPAFLAMLAAAGAPLGLAVFAFACSSNLSAGLTHYGTTPLPMFYAQGYVSMRSWWRLGFTMSLVNLVIWATAGVLWWKLIGVW